jgi:erythromycin esterase-like protein
MEKRSQAMDRAERKAKAEVAKKKAEAVKALRERQEKEVAAAVRQVRGVERDGEGCRRIEQEPASTPYFTRRGKC